VSTEANLEQMENGEWFASSHMYPGLWATGKTETEALDELRDVIDGARKAGLL